MDITTTVYRSNFDRNWYKLDKVKAQDSTGNVSIASVMSDPARYSEELEIIKGVSSQHEDALKVKANNRSYYLEGIESIIGINFPQGLVSNELELGIRLHRDQMDRHQWIDEYEMDEGIMKLTKAGIHGTESNYILDAKAVASFIQYRLEYQKLTITPGIRFEHVKYIKTDYGKEDPDRSGGDRSKTDHKVDIFIPGLGIDYAFTDHLSSFLGIHKGFSPPGMKKDTKPEISINYEAGIRYNVPMISFQSVVYFNDYENLLGSDLAAGGGSGSGNQFNGGESLIYGIEYDMTINLLNSFSSRLRLPVTFNYTYTHATFQNDFESEFEPWGTVKAGDYIPYIPKHQLAFNISLDHEKFNVNYSSKLVGDMRTIAGQGDIPDHEKIPLYYVGDLSFNVIAHKFITLFGNINNLFNNVYAVSRRPAGIRPGMPISFRLGLKAHIY
jgi:Fe(3+) dicitrate transport protein